MALDEGLLTRSYGYNERDLFLDGCFDGSGHSLPPAKYTRGIGL